MKIANWLAWINCAFKIVCRLIDPSNLTRGSKEILLKLNHFNNIEVQLHQTTEMKTSQLREIKSKAAKSSSTKEKESKTRAITVIFRRFSSLPSEALASVLVKITQI
jgi:hypothetical protein